VAHQCLRALRHGVDDHGQDQRVAYLRVPPWGQVLKIPRQTGDSRALGGARHPRERGVYHHQIHGGVDELCQEQFAHHRCLLAAGAVMPLVAHHSRDDLLEG